MNTRIMPVTDFRRQTSRVIQSVHDSDETIYLTQHGRPKVVLIDYSRYEAMMERLTQRDEWPADFFAQTYGALADEPLERAEQPAYDERELLQ